MSNPKLPHEELVRQVQKLLESPTGPLTSLGMLGSTKRAPKGLGHAPDDEREGPPTPRTHHEKKAGVVGRVGKTLASGEGRLADFGKKLIKHEDKIELGGLGLLGTVPAYEVAHEIHKKKEDRDYGEIAKNTVEGAGLLTLSAPYISKAMMGVSHKTAAMHGCLDELEKLGESSTISAEDARRSLDRLDALEKNKPTKAQIVRNLAVGAGTGVGVGALGKAIADVPQGGKRGAAAAAVTGALAAGGVPLLQQHLARNDEKKQLKRFVEQEFRDHGPDTGATDMQKAAAAEVFDELQALLANPAFLKTASTQEIAELAKVAIEMADIRAATTKVAAGGVALPKPTSLQSVPGVMSSIRATHARASQGAGHGTPGLENALLNAGRHQHPLYPEKLDRMTYDSRGFHDSNIGPVADQLHEESKFFNPQSKATSRGGSPPPASKPLQVVKDPFPQAAKSLYKADAPPKSVEERPLREPLGRKEHTRRPVQYGDTPFRSPGEPLNPGIESMGDKPLPPPMAPKPFSSNPASYAPQKIHPANMGAAQRAVPFAGG